MGQLIQKLVIKEQTGVMSHITMGYGLQQQKKQLQNDKSIAWENRLIAKNISAEEFRLKIQPKS